MIRDKGGGTWLLATKHTLKWKDNAHIHLKSDSTNVTAKCKNAFQVVLSFVYENSSEHMLQAVSAKRFCGVIGDMEKGKYVASLQTKNMTVTCLFSSCRECFMKAAGLLFVIRHSHCKYLIRCFGFDRCEDHCLLIKMHTYRNTESLWQQLGEV